MMNEARQSGDHELVYRYSGPPKLELWRRPLGDGRFMHWMDQQDRVPGVVIIPTDGRSVVLIRQWRESIGRDVWQFPRGYRDGGDADALTAAARELAEETGIVGQARLLGTIWTDPGLLSTSIVAVEVRAELGQALGSHDPGERILEHRVVEIASVPEWIRDGRLSDGISLAAWALHAAARPPA